MGWSCSTYNNHTSLTWEVLLRGPNNLEFLSLSIRSSCSVFKHCVSVLYRPPSSPVSFFDNLCSTLQHLSPHLFTNFVLVGDFNINFCNKDHPYFCRLRNIFQTFSLSQVVLSPTLTNSNGHASLIDLALVSSKSQLLDCSVTPPLVNADHNGLELSFKWKHTDRQVRTIPRAIWRYKDADYRKACQMIEETDWDQLLHENDMDCSATNWHTKFMEIMSACIPRQNDSKSAPGKKSSPGGGGLRIFPPPPPPPERPSQDNFSSPRVESPAHAQAEIARACRNEPSLTSSNLSLISSEVVP